jgi:hypothetical protein
MALRNPNLAWSKKLSYPGPRRTVQERAVNAALDCLRRELVRAQAPRTSNVGCWAFAAVQGLATSP